MVVGGVNWEKDMKLLTCRGHGHHLGNVARQYKVQFKAVSRLDEEHRDPRVLLTLVIPRLDQSFVTEVSRRIGPIQIVVPFETLKRKELLPLQNISRVPYPIFHLFLPWQRQWVVTIPGPVEPCEYIGD